MARKKKPARLVLHLDTDQSSSLLFKLPPELRTQIYEYVAMSTKLSYGPRRGNTGQKKLGRAVWRKSGKPQSPGLVVTCKQIYHESITIFYSYAKFDFWKHAPLLSWLRSVSGEYLKMVHRVVLILGIGSECLLVKANIQSQRQKTWICQDRWKELGWEVEATTSFSDNLGKEAVRFRETNGLSAQQQWF